ncbi:MAG: hypothetical protein JEY91_10615 [Spirochaetaceae bacterium]|nr:hypothetical protein [Spirochaetaceae bacterium]
MKGYELRGFSTNEPGSFTIFRLNEDGSEELVSLMKQDIEPLANGIVLTPTEDSFAYNMYPDVEDFIYTDDAGIFLTSEASDNGYHALQLQSIGEYGFNLSFKALKSLEILVYSEEEQSDYWLDNGFLEKESESGGKGRNNSNGNGSTLLPDNLSFNTYSISVDRDMFFELNNIPFDVYAPIIFFREREDTE